MGQLDLTTKDRAMLPNQLSMSSRLESISKGAIGLWRGCHWLAAGRQAMSAAKGQAERGIVLLPDQLSRCGRLLRCLPIL